MLNEGQEKRLMKLKNGYLDEHGRNILTSLSKEGVFPSPYNFVAHNCPPTDGYVIHDSTLREGEQTPGVIFTIEDKKRIAEKLDAVGIQQIETGFPVASEKQRKGVKALVNMDLDTEIFCFARAKHEDIDAVAETGADGIIISFSISEHHRRHKFHGMTKEEYLNRLDDTISYAEKYGLFIVYTAEDSTRENDLDFLKKAFKKAEEAGANRARIADTLGCINPSGIAYLVRETKSVLDIPLEVHCHNDMGLALANSLAAVEAGASTISATVNGLGERSGVTPTEEVIAALHVIFGIKTFDMSQLTELSRFVESITGVRTAPNKPVTGENACTHCSGIHQHGILMNPTTYEVYPPELVGQKRRVYIDELCGSHGILYVAEKKLGMNISRDTARKVISKIKRAYLEEDRQSAYTLTELEKLILEAQSAEAGGTAAVP